jgi:hypothetical protein
VSAKQYDTWSGVRISPAEVFAFARQQDFQLLVIEQAWTQYMWITCRKRQPGWRTRPAAPAGPSAIRNISNALTGEAVAPASGALAALSLWIHNLPGDCDLMNTRVMADGGECRLTYIGPAEHDGITQVNVALPVGIRTGLVPVEVFWNEQPLCVPAWVRIAPAGPSVPRVTTITDGVNLISGTRIISRTVKVTMIEVRDASVFHAAVDGYDAVGIDSFCADPVTLRYEFNFKLPDRIGVGAHEVSVRLGKRNFAPLSIEVA